jgi:hypothetical protein
MEKTRLSDGGSAWVDTAESNNSHKLTGGYAAPLSGLTGVPRIEAIFRAHLGNDRKILAASGETNDG